MMAEPIIEPQMSQMNADTNPPVSLKVWFCSSLDLRPLRYLRFNSEPFDTNQTHEIRSDGDVALHLVAKNVAWAREVQLSEWPRMNVHHLELFYYVARFGGISRAVRRMPYGIQQPAVSSQMLLLEQDLGKRLFERIPFRLTREGEELFAFVSPFFSNLDVVASSLRKQAEPQLRIGASEIVLRDHLPQLLTRLQKSHPGLRITLRSGFQAQMEAALQEQEIDLAITPLESKPPPRIHSLRLVRMPLVLLVPKTLKIKSAATLWAQKTVEYPLISLPATETVSRQFQKGLQRLKVDWPMHMEASSLDLITRYVANGYGIGLSVYDNEIVRHPQVRVLDLPGFDPIEIAAFWKGAMTPIVREILEDMQRYAERSWPAWCSADVIR
jgi:DNA-binding transcriptional LysR family regulator